MNPFALEAVTRDNDVAAQARAESGAPLPGPNLRDGARPDAAGPDDAAGGAALGTGAVAGAAAGAALGTVVGGPGGAVVGGVVGAVTGALGGAAAVPAQQPDDPGDTIPGPQEREVTRVGELHQEDLRR